MKRTPVLVIEVEGGKVTKAWGHVPDGVDSMLIIDHDGSTDDPGKPTVEVMGIRDLIIGLYQGQLPEL